MHGVCTPVNNFSKLLMNLHTHEDILISELALSVPYYSNEFKEKIIKKLLVLK